MNNNIRFTLFDLRYTLMFAVISVLAPFCGQSFGADADVYVSIETSPYVLPITPMPDPYYLEIGTKDNSDAEFLQSNYPGSPFLAKVQISTSFPKELNTYGYGVQYINVTLSTTQANWPLSFELNPAWSSFSSNSRALRVTIEVNTGSEWREADRTLVNTQDSGYLDVQTGFLRPGVNSFRLNSVTAGGNDVVTWDQIIIKTAPYNRLWTIGTNNSSNSEFAPAGGVSPFVIGTTPDSSFRNQINMSTHKDQEIDFYMSADQCQKAAVLSLDPYSYTGNSTMTVGVYLYQPPTGGSGYVNITSFTIASGWPCSVVIPAYYLKEGNNQLWLHASSGTTGTSYVMWDSISMFQRSGLPLPVDAVLRDVLDASLNYFLDPNVIHASGMPLTAYKVLDRKRFGYSNPTEWGHAMQAWIAAAEMGKITTQAATDKLTTILNTLEAMQQPGSGQFSNTYGLFYPFYTLVDANTGVDLPSPSHDNNHELPSGDNALLYGSINACQGWLQLKGQALLAQQAQRIKNNIHINSCIEYYVDSNSVNCARIHHSINADTGLLSGGLYPINADTWDTYADEGGIVAFTDFISRGNVADYTMTSSIRSQLRQFASWNNINVFESVWFNAMFTWGQRPIAGLPMFGTSQARQYGIKSFLPNMRAHLEWGNYLGIVYSGFSDAMTQTSGGKELSGDYTPPNTAYLFDPINNPYTTVHNHMTPHALAVPFCALDVLDEYMLKNLYEKWVLLRADTSGVWHPSGGQDPYGMEVLCSPNVNNAGYGGADDGRFIWETLSEGYTIFSLYEGLKRYGDRRTFNYFAGWVDGFNYRVTQALSILYPQY